VGFLDLGLGLLDRVRISALMPRVDIGVEGTAKLCTQDHVMVFYLPMGADLNRTIAQHIDVSIELWNKGNRGPVALIELRAAKAARQPLDDRIDPFRPLTLEQGSLKMESYFALAPTDGRPLKAAEGDWVAFSLRLGRNGRDRRVRLRLLP
jgi:hypothetical protein